MNTQNYTVIRNWNHAHITKIYASNKEPAIMQPPSYKMAPFSHEPLEHLGHVVIELQWQTNKAWDMATTMTASMETLLLAG